jgi:hypothetical protein
MQKSSIHIEAEQEAAQYTWIESEKAGYDLGEQAVWQWVRQHWWGFLRTRWLEHLQGKRFWIELDRGDFGILQWEFREDAILLDRILDRLKAGQANLDILNWAVGWGIPTQRVFRILEVLDINSRRMMSRFDPFGDPVVTLDPAWRTWNDGTVPRLARGIAERGDFESLPILADALEDAGCTDAIILGHCRSAGRDVRRSWVVDAILAESSR